MPVCLVCERTVGFFGLKDGVCEKCLSNESNSNSASLSADTSNNANSEMPSSSIILYILSLIFLIATLFIAPQFWPGESFKQQSIPPALYMPFIISLLSGIFMAGVLFSFGKAISLLSKIATKN